MERRERERILGEHPPRGAQEQTVRERRLAERLACDLQGSPLVGRPLPARRRNFSLSAERYALSIAGPPAHSRRLREIEDEISAHEAALPVAWEELQRELAGKPEELARRWRAIARAWNFGAVNELIRVHNLWYPVEARLPMDPRTRDFVPVGGRPYRLRPLDADWILKRFPAEPALAA